MSETHAPSVQMRTKEAPRHWWTSVGWTVVGLAFVAGGSGAIYNRYYTGSLDSETRQKYTAVVTFMSILVVRVAHTVWTQFRNGENSKRPNKQTPSAADTRGDEGTASVARRRRPRRDT